MTNMSTFERQARPYSVRNLIRANACSSGIEQARILGLTRWRAPGQLQSPNGGSYCPLLNSATWVLRNLPCDYPSINQTNRQDELVITSPEGLKLELTPIGDVKLTWNNRSDPFEQSVSVRGEHIIGHRIHEPMLQLVPDAFPVRTGAVFDCTSNDQPLQDIQVEHPIRFVINSRQTQGTASVYGTDIEYVLHTVEKRDRTNILDTGLVEMKDATLKIRRSGDLLAFVGVIEAPIDGMGMEAVAIIEGHFDPSGHGHVWETGLHQSGGEYSPSIQVPKEFRQLKGKTVIRMIDQQSFKDVVLTIANCFAQWKATTLERFTEQFTEKLPDDPAFTLMEYVENREEVDEQIKLLCERSQTTREPVGLFNTRHPHEYIVVDKDGKSMGLISNNRLMYVVNGWVISSSVHSQTAKTTIARVRASHTNVNTLMNDAVDALNDYFKVIYGANSYRDVYPGREMVKLPFWRRLTSNKVRRQNAHDKLVSRMRDIYVRAKSAHARLG
ncbi:hypothetical protein EniLVp02_0106 [Vibrio phage EniLVp02]